MLGGGTQAFCTNDDCDLMVWNPAVPLLEANWQEVRFTDDGAGNLDHTQRPISPADAIRHLFGVDKP